MPMWDRFKNWRAISTPMSARFVARSHREPCVAGRPVDVAHLKRVEEGAPLLLDRILDEGRVLIDRDGEWRDLRERRRAIRARAQRNHRRKMASAVHAIEELTR